MVLVAVDELGAKPVYPSNLIESCAAAAAAVAIALCASVCIYIRRTEFLEGSRGMVWVEK